MAVQAAFRAKHAGNTFPRSLPIMCLGKWLPKIIKPHGQEEKGKTVRERVWSIDEEEAARVAMHTYKNMIMPPMKIAQTVAPNDDAKKSRWAVFTAVWTVDLPRRSSGPRMTATVAKKMTGVTWSNIATTLAESMKTKKITVTGTATQQCKGCHLPAAN
jgi:hypothetical protein